MPAWWVEHRSTRRWLGHHDESRNADVGRSPTHGGCLRRLRIQSRGTFVGRAPLDAASAWVPRRIQERGRRAEPDPRGLFATTTHPVARPLRGSSTARRGDGLGTTANPGTQASGAARPTGVACGDYASSREAPSWVEHRSTRRWLGHDGESRNAGVGRCPTHGDRFRRLRIQSRGPFVGRAPLDAAMAWARRRIQERGRRAEPDPRGLFAATTHPVARPLRGSSTARHGDGLDTTTNPGTRASGEARPTGVVCGDYASSRAAPSWVEHGSTRRWLGHHNESRNTGIGGSPTHGSRAVRRRVGGSPYAAIAPPSRRRMMSSASPMIRSMSSFTPGTSWMSPATKPQLHAPASMSPCCITRG